MTIPSADARPYPYRIEHREPGCEPRILRFMLTHRVARHALVLAARQLQFDGELGHAVLIDQATGLPVESYDLATMLRVSEPAEPTT